MAAIGMEKAVKILKRLKSNWGPVMVLPFLMAFPEV